MSKKTDKPDKDAKHEAARKEANDHPESGDEDDEAFDLEAEIDMASEEEAEDDLFVLVDDPDDE